MRNGSRWNWQPDEHFEIPFDSSVSRCAKETGTTVWE